MMLSISNRIRTRIRMQMRVVWGSLALAVLVWCGGAGLAQAQDPGSVPGPVLKIFGVGGVLTEDGTLWQFNPEKGWKTIDEAFSEEGKETNILPLPVPASSIEEIVTFGFLLTDNGDCWLFDLKKGVWEKLPPPGR